MTDQQYRRKTGRQFPGKVVSLINLPGISVLELCQAVRNGQGRGIDNPDIRGKLILKLEIAASLRSDNEQRRGSFAL